MIISFSIENFGSIKSKQTVSFEADKSTHLEDAYLYHAPNGLRLLKLILIYGANASGKTTVLNAIEFLRDLVLDPAEKKTDELKFNPFLFDNKSPKQDSKISIDFLQNEVKYSYEVEFSSKAVVNEKLLFFNPNKAIVFKRTTDTKKQFSKITFGSKIKVEKNFKNVLEANTLWNNTVFGGYLKTNIEQIELKEVTDWFDKYLHPIVTPKTSLHNFVGKKVDNSEVKEEELVKIIKKADFNISGIKISEEEGMPDDVEKFFKALNYPDEQIEKMKKNPPKKIEFQHTVDGSQYFLPIELESEGTKRYFEFSGLLALLIRNSIAVPIDELESSLHPELYIHFILSFLMNSNKSQIIATTHNRELLDNKDIFRNDAIWFTNKTEHCSTEIYSLADFDTTVIRDTTNIYNAYKSGKLKATPNLSDYYID
jgi:AAA15 family ATPase/GTPase